MCFQWCFFQHRLLVKIQQDTRGLNITSTDHKLKHSWQCKYAQSNDELSLRLQLYLSLPLPTIHRAGLQHKWKIVNRPGRFLCGLHRDGHKCGEEQGYIHIFYKYCICIASSLRWVVILFKNRILELILYVVGQSRWRIPDCPLQCTECQRAICCQRCWFYCPLIIKAATEKVI